jgi:hypothetical protein
MGNYFNYFTEIEEHFQRRRGTTLLLSTLDWALIETWKDAGIPLAAVLRGIDSAFDRYDRRPSKTRKVNSLAYCSQEILAAAEEIKEAAVGGVREEKEGFDAAEVTSYLKRNAELLEQARVPEQARGLALEAARSLRDLAAGVEVTRGRLEELEQRLTVLEEKFFAALLAATSDDELVSIRGDADRDIAPYRSKMSGPQIEQLHRQYVHKALMQRHGVPRLSLFYLQ